MKNNKIHTKIEEFIKYNYEHESLMEYARVSNLSEEFEQKVGKIEVFGGGFKGHQKEHNPPHFRVSKNGGDVFRVKIPLVDKSKLVLDDIIILDDNNVNSKTLKLLLKWLKEDSIVAQKSRGKNVHISNLKFMVETWNLLNSEDNNVDTIDTDIFFSDIN